MLFSVLFPENPEVKLAGASVALGESLCHWRCILGAINLVILHQINFTVFLFI